MDARRPGNMQDPNSQSIVDPNPSIEQLTRRVRQTFEQRFGRAPRWLAAAPGRVNLIGEHTDYNDGFVLPMAIERYTVVAADTAIADFRVYSTATDQMVTWPADGTPTIDDRSKWINYVWGVLAESRAAGRSAGPLDMIVDSSVPVGGGLSSSAALEVATATLLEAATHHVMEPVEKALLCQKAEHEYAGMPCGIMDQFTSVMGRENQLILLDCRSTEVQLVPLAGDGVSVLITNTNVKHELTGGEYAERRQQCEAAAAYFDVASLRDCTPAQIAAAPSNLDSVLRRRARHVVSEIARTVEAAAAIRAGDWTRMGQLMCASHASLRDDYEVSCDELDLLVELAETVGLDGGVYGARMTGGGFGGCTVSLVRTDRVAQIAQTLTTRYQTETGVSPTLLISRPARGAWIVN